MKFRAGCIPVCIVQCTVRHLHSPFKCSCWCTAALHLSAHPHCRLYADMVIEWLQQTLEHLTLHPLDSADEEEAAEALLPPLYKASPSIRLVLCPAAGLRASMVAQQYRSWAIKGDPTVLAAPLAGPAGQLCSKDQHLPDGGAVQRGCERPRGLCLCGRRQARQAQDWMGGHTAGQLAGI